MLSGRAEDGQQMYFGGSVVGKASAVGIGISPTSPLIFTGGRQKVRNEIWRCLKHYPTLSRPRLKMQQGIRILEQKCNAAMIALCSGHVWWSWVHSWEPLGKSAPTPKIARRKRAKSSVTQPWNFRFRLNFVHSLNVWHRKCCKSSRSRGQRSRSRRVALLIFGNLHTKVFNVRKSQVGRCIWSAASRNRAAWWLFVHAALARFTFKT